MNLVSQHAFFLNANGRALSSTCFRPASVRGAALLIPPLAEERKGALPVFAQTARALAATDIAVLLFDFTGCGDSEGDFADTAPEIIESDCEAALAWLAAAFPERPLTVLGLRTGAVLASRLASKRSDVAALVCWSPVAGPDFIRQLLQRRMVNDMVAYGKAQESRVSLETRLRRGETVDLDGYPFSGAFYAWAQALQPQPVAAPTLVISGGHDDRTAAACAAAAAAERSALRYPPFWNTVGHVDVADLVQETVGWIGARIPERAAAPLPVSDLCATSPFGELADLCAGPTVRGIFDTPSGTPCGGVLFLHGWSGDRTGPHRLFTRFARQLARSGYLCARPDFIGRGLSDGEACDASIARMTEDARAALSALQRRLPPGAPVALAAICSGCKVAISLAAHRQDIARLLLWSAESMGSLRSAATGRRKTLSALGTYARKLLRPETWKKILSGNVQSGLVTRALVKHETRSADEARQEDDTLKAFRTFRHPALFVFGGSDPDAPGSSRAYARYCRKSGIPFSLHTVANAGHSYYGEQWTRELIESGARFLSAHSTGWTPDEQTPSDR